jgi:hypothetical protein
MFSRNEWLGVLGLILGIISLVIPFFIDLVEPASEYSDVVNNVAFFVMGIALTIVLNAILNRKKFISGKPTILIPLKANEHELELWSKRANEHFDVEQFQLSVEYYRGLYLKSPNSFRIFKSRSTGMVVGGYVFLFVGEDVANKILRGELFMVDITPNMLCSPSQAFLIHVCDIVSDRVHSPANNVIMFDIFSQLIGTVKALENIKSITAHSIDGFYESLLQQMGFTYKPIQFVERTGRKLWVAESNSLRTISWTANQYI